MLCILSLFFTTWWYAEMRKIISSNQRREKLFLSNQQTEGRKETCCSLQRPFLPLPRPAPHRVSPRCDVTERWRLSRFTVRKKSPCSLLPPRPRPTLRYSSSLISAAPIPSLSCLKLPLLLPIIAFGASSSAT